MGLLGIRFNSIHLRRGLTEHDHMVFTGEPKRKKIPATASIIRRTNGGAAHRVDRSDPLLATRVHASEDHEKLKTVVSGYMHASDTWVEHAAMRSKLNIGSESWVNFDRFSYIKSFLAKQLPGYILLNWKGPYWKKYYYRIKLIS